MCSEKINPSISSHHEYPTFSENVWKWIIFNGRESIKTIINLWNQNANINKSQ